MNAETELKFRIAPRQMSSVLRGHGFARRHLSGIKIPRQIDFMRELPRHPTGKLYKRLIRDTYWAKPR